MEGLKLVCTRELLLRRSFSSSACVPGGVRGPSLESVSKTLIPNFEGSKNISMVAIANSLNNSGCGTNWNSRSGQRRVLQTMVTSQPSYRSPSRWDLVSSAGVTSNQAHFRRSAQRHLNSKPWNATRNISMNAASGGPPRDPPQQESIIGKFIEQVIQFIVSLLPSKAFIEKVEEEVDAAAEMVKEAAELVVEVADEVEKFSNIAEMKAEDVEKMAEKVTTITEEVKVVVDDVADVLEGEKGISSLVDTYQDSKKHGSETEAAAATVAETS